MEIPKRTHSIERKINEWYENNTKDKSRFHLGCSGLGHECNRKIWLDFRWVLPEQFPGRILRLFERGAEEEFKIAKQLKAIGINIQNTGDDQLFVDLGCHVGGSIDGVIEGGYPCKEKSRAVCEMKTHSKKSFDDLVKNGVAKSKPQHLVQMSCYAYAIGVDRMFYFAVCKDDDRIHTEWLELDVEFAEKQIEKGHRIATQDEMPPPLSEDPTWWKCRYCHYNGKVCFTDEPIVQKSCRTCAYSTALDDGTWFCEYHKGEIAQEYQAEGCKHYEIHDHLEK